MLDILHFELTVPLGAGASILYIEGNGVIYKIGDELYEAQISKNGFENAKLITTDPEIRNFVWAFRIKKEQGNNMKIMK